MKAFRKNKIDLVKILLIAISIYSGALIDNSLEILSSRYLFFLALAPLTFIGIGNPTNKLLINIAFIIPILLIELLTISVLLFLILQYLKKRNIFLILIWITLLLAGQILNTFIEKSTADNLKIKLNPPNCCNPVLSTLGYVCMNPRICGPPVYSPSYYSAKVVQSCLSPSEVNYALHGMCPICLSSSTLITTPKGKVNVKKIKVGDLVLTIDKKGTVKAVPVLKVSNVEVPKRHKVVHLLLKDKREVYVSPGHPDIENKSVGSLRVGDSYNGSIVIKAEFVLYTDLKTYDLLPAGDTGFYFADEILLGSTLK